MERIKRTNQSVDILSPWKIYDSFKEFDVSLPSLIDMLKNSDFITQVTLIFYYKLVLSYIGYETERLKTNGTKILDDVLS
jgi:hypothetical protein